MMGVSARNDEDLFKGDYRKKSREYLIDTIWEYYQWVKQIDKEWNAKLTSALKRESSVNARVTAYEIMLANYDKLGFLIGNPFIWEGLKLLLEREPMRLGPAMTRNALETYEDFYREWKEIDTFEWDMAKPTKATLEKNKDG